MKARHAVPWGLVLLGAALAARGAEAPRRPMPPERMVERIRQFDADGDARVTREEFKGPEAIFRRVDSDGDGVISDPELQRLLREGPGAERPDPGQPVGAIPKEVKPLSEMTAEDRYKGEDGGLYGRGLNTPPEAHLAAAMAAAREIRPLDAAGNPAADGKIGFVALGMSNTTQEFQAFLRMLRETEVRPGLIAVDGAQGGKEATAWANEPPDRRTGRTPWEELAARLEAEGLSAPQVQVVWMKLAVAGPARAGEYPAHIDAFRELVTTVLQKLKARYPNVRIVYLSNRIYAGYATTQLNPEPYAYEYAYGIRALIREQIDGNPALNADPARGEVKAPLLLWGPDLWANGPTPRADGLAWEKDDLGPDGTHPSTAGRDKVADCLLRFLRTDPNARVWFVGN